MKSELPSRSTAAITISVVRLNETSRETNLKSCGYRVLRFWNNDVLDNLEGVLIVIQECVRCGVSTKPPTPNPSPPQAGGGGLP